MSFSDKTSYQISKQGPDQRVPLCSPSEEHVSSIHSLSQIGFHHTFYKRDLKPSIPSHFFWNILLYAIDIYYILIFFSSIVNSVRETCADWLRGVEPQDDPVLKGKKDPDEGFHIKVPRRNVGPSSTQVLNYYCLIYATRPSYTTSNVSFLLYMNDE